MQPSVPNKKRRRRSTIEFTGHIELGSNEIDAKFDLRCKLHRRLRDGSSRVQNLNIIIPNFIAAAYGQACEANRQTIDF